MTLPGVLTFFGLALVGVGLHQRRMAGRTPQRQDKQVADRFGALIVGGMVFALNALAAPSFTIAVGMATTEQHLPVRILLLVCWNLIYQAPLVTVTLAAQVDAHERILTAVRAFFAPRRWVLLIVFAVVLCAVGVVVTVDGVVGLASTHHPCLRDLLGLR
jgi:cytochrome c biogenesis protein CcdA